MGQYGAVKTRSSRGAVFGALFGVLVLAGIAIGIIYYQSSERRRLDTMDLEALGAELAAIKAASQPLDRLELLARPDSLPADYTQAVADARAAWEKHMAVPRRTNALPSKRPWPPHFAAAEKLAKDSLDHFAVVSFYLDQRSKISTSKPGATVTVDTDLANVAELGIDPLEQLKDLLASMEAQQSTMSWNYSADALK